MLSGVSPCAICQAMSPLFKLIAVFRPYGGLTIGNPCTFSPPPPPPASSAPPRPPPAAAGAAGAVPRPPRPRATAGAGDAGLRARPDVYDMSDRDGSGGLRPIDAIEVFEKT